MVVLPCRKESAYMSFRVNFRFIILGVRIRHCILRLLVIELLLVRTTLYHESGNLSEFPFSFLLCLSSNHQTIKIEPGNSGQLPFSFLLVLVSKFQNIKFTPFCMSSLRSHVGSSALYRLIWITSTGRHPSSLLSVYNTCNRAYQNIVLNTLPTR